jgi:hypothetical protein
MNYMSTLKKFLEMLKRFQNELSSCHVFIFLVLHSIVMNYHVSVITDFHIAGVSTLKCTEC